ncbi:MAG: PIN domain nuclease [Candidatus Omnitrophica bacterium CG_4_9_14_0_2_um_filter_42_8]|nr:MAG: PIN domain nuclease [Candidatus Omnitrophica bacterium CG22_combo_CG10-13_8_21_14_all_43_16]PJC48626.1 MAG: PIN domain nuclease [Candidatus Omnitrophica bacterium CG_4_9_14_0_2_um_filter_42_8]
MTLIFIRVFFVVLSVIIGFQIGSFVQAGSADFSMLGASIGFLIAMLIIILEFTMRKVSVRGLSSAVFGLLFGLIMAKLVSDTLALISFDKNLVYSLRVVLTLVFCYLGMIMAIRGRDEFNIIVPYVKFSRQDQRDEMILLDTSVIIDGRIADICKTGFLDGKFIVPRFVLKELQQVADSADSLKRERGKRGLDILGKLQKNPNIDVKIHNDDFPDIKEVDLKLVKLAKVLGAKIFTNDYNLNKVSEIQGIRVLNVNELANSLRPVVLPGEMIETRLIKEGKEYNQGVGYLEDGTMIVVDNGRRLIGQNVNVVVGSVLQTAAGRMIFGKLPDDNKRNK